MQRATRLLWPWSRTTAWRRVKEVMKTAGVQGPCAMPKGLRHAFGVNAFQKQIPQHLIQRWLGHASLRTTAIYGDATGDEERAIRGKDVALLTVHPCYGAHFRNDVSPRIMELLGAIIMDHAYRVVLTTTGSKENAKAVVDAVLSKKLAACIQVFPIESHYVWEGKINNDSEFMLFFKAKASDYGDLEET